MENEKIELAEGANPNRGTALVTLPPFGSELDEFWDSVLGDDVLPEEDSETLVPEDVLRELGLPRGGSR